jgi:hypothetical protein
VVALAIICIEDDDATDELSVELEILLIAVVGTPVSDEDIVVSMEVAYECDVDDDDKYSLEIDVLPVALIVFSLAVLEIAFAVVEVNCVVDNSDLTDKVRSFVNMDVSDEIVSLNPVVADAVDNEFVCSMVECVECSDAAGMDVTTVEVKSTNNSVVVGPIVFIVVPSVDMSKDEDREEYPVELIEFSFVVDVEVDNDSMDSEYVVGACVYRIVFSVLPVRIVDHAKGDDSIELGTSSGVID